MKTKSTTAERLAARRLQAERVALLEDYVSNHTCEKNPSMCAICAPAITARWSARATRSQPRPKSNMQFTVEGFRRSLSYR